MPLPSLPDLLRHLADMPASFRATPAGFPGGRIRVRAVVADLVESLQGSSPSTDTLRAFDPADLSPLEQNRLRWTLAAAHLFRHPAFREVKSGAAERFLVEELPVLAGMVSAGKLEVDEERREELVRRALRAAGLRLPGESREEAEDRPKQVDSIEGRRLAAESVERMKQRAAERAKREAMARKAAEEAAARMSRE